MPAANIQSHPIGVSRFRGRLRTPSALLLLGILVAAVVLRAYWISHHPTLMIGVDHLRIAENLLNRGSYVGLFEGPELVTPPFFPVLLAVSSLFVGSVQGAAHVVALVAGVLLVPIAFVLARFIYGARVALAIAALIALDPVLIELSSTALSETVYLPLMLAGFYLALRTLDVGSAATTV